jgi:hypothetical protein
MVVLCSSRLAGAVNAGINRYERARRKPYSINTLPHCSDTGGATIRQGGER